mgnify:CR=1 FL=1
MPEKLQIIFRMKRNIFTIVIIFIGFVSIAQEEHHNDFKHFRISPVLSHTYIPMATINGNETVIIPTLGLDLEYWFTPKWGFGFHNDLELLTFEIEKDHQLFVEKEFPVVLTLDSLWKFYKDWVLVFGTGIEIETNENLFIVRTGIEYEIEFGNHWDVAPTIFYDYRSNNFGTWSVGIGIGKRF